MLSDNLAVSNSLVFKMEDIELISGLLDRLSEVQREALVIRDKLVVFMESISESFNNQEILLMLRNKWGLTKKDAKKLFYKYHGGEEDEENVDNDNPEPENNPGKSGSVDQKISMIMDYMKETSSKLDSIDRDIAQLKDQVEEILRRM